MALVHQLIRVGPNSSPNKCWDLSPVGAPVPAAVILGLIWQEAFDNARTRERTRSN